MELVGRLVGINNIPNHDIILNKYEIFQLSADQGLFSS